MTAYGDSRMRTDKDRRFGALIGARVVIFLAVAGLACSAPAQAQRQDDDRPRQRGADRQPERAPGDRGPSRGPEREMDRRGPDSDRDFLSGPRVRQNKAPGTEGMFGEMEDGQRARTRAAQQVPPMVIQRAIQELAKSHDDRIALRPEQQEQMKELMGSYHAQVRDWMESHRQDLQSLREHAQQMGVEPQMLNGPWAEFMRDQRRDQGASDAPGVRGGDNGDMPFGPGARRGQNRDGGPAGPGARGNQRGQQERGEGRGDGDNARPWFDGRAPNDRTPNEDRVRDRQREREMEQDQRISDRRPNRDDNMQDVDRGPRGERGGPDGAGRQQLMEHVQRLRDSFPPTDRVVHEAWRILDQDQRAFVEQHIARYHEQQEQRRIDADQRRYEQRFRDQAQDRQAERGDRQQRRPGAGRGGDAEIPEELRERIMRRIESLPPDQREEAIAQMRQRVERLRNASPEERREALRKLMEQDGSGETDRPQQRRRGDGGEQSDRRPPRTRDLDLPQPPKQ